MDPHAALKSPGRKPFRPGAAGTVTPRPSSSHQLPTAPPRTTQTLPPGTQGKADISTLLGGGHFYFALTPGSRDFA